MSTGTLYLCGLPIGNLEDISARVLSTLRNVDVIAAEDTRKTALLLSQLNIGKPLISYHDHTEKEKKNELLELLNNGKNIALVSDAGMPLISDPGYHLVKTLLANNVSIQVIPGPTALITALVGSGLPTDRFVFEGFLPAKPSQRQEHLRTLLTETRTIICYEAPHRLKETLEDCLKIFGNRQAFVARELTKKYEETFFGNLEEIILKTQKEPRGEYVIIISGAEIIKSSVHEHEKLIKALRKKLTAKEVAAILEEGLGLAKNEVKKALYQDDII